MLFSEPKIPQSQRRRKRRAVPVRFSALQRAENSSIVPAPRDRVCYYVGFSALQRAENSSIALSAQEGSTVTTSFSALQRAENSSIMTSRRAGRELARFQCSSASRKFLNHQPNRRQLDQRRSFSALQRAENSST